MVNRILLSIVCVVVLATSASAQDVSAIYNNYATQYNFDLLPEPATSTFADAYNGTNLEADLAALIAAISAEAPAKVDIGGDDLLVASLEHWGE
jgi:hypothetical protein